MTVLLGSFSGHLMLSAYDAVKLVGVFLQPPSVLRLRIVQVGSQDVTQKLELPRIVDPQATGTTVVGESLHLAADFNTGHMPDPGAPICDASASPSD